MLYTVQKQPKQKCLCIEKIEKVWFETCTVWVFFMQTVEQKNKKPLQTCKYSLHILALRIFVTAKYFASGMLT